jgi:hypothetical protein
MKKFSESTGHKDLEGNWVNETPQAKLRNQLGPFWTLIDLLSEDRLDKVLKHPSGLEMIQNCLKQCKDNQQKILDLIKETGKPS